MHHGHGRHGRLQFRRPFPNRQELLARLEAYQRDLEEELADLDDLIRHLRGDGDATAPEPATEG